MWRKDGSDTCAVLPGSTLAYSHQDALSKAIALLWACWLVAGPDYEDMRYFCDKVRGITTDGGVELGTLDTPDILRAFIAWVDGRPLDECALLVNHDLRLWPFALRITGWSHALGNLMKTLAAVCIRWPVIIEQLRSLLIFSRMPLGDTLLSVPCPPMLTLNV